MKVVLLTVEQIEKFKMSYALKLNKVYDSEYDLSEKTYMSNSLYSFFKESTSVYGFEKNGNVVAVTNKKSKRIYTLELFNYNKDGRKFLKTVSSL